MAINASTQVMYDGTVNCVIKCIGLCDGGSESPNETFVTKVSVRDLVPNGGLIKIKSIIYDVAYGVVTLSWDASPPIDFIHLDGSDNFVFPMGGLINNTGDGSSTGDILLTTRGFDTNSSYSIILNMRKRF